ncbi:hypothetical protein [Rhodoferax sp. WC2427]|uniref:hypothetical protein n=1 Tax=Rhodoferax sp. WC2427 TaxID=3234144 RepID=UPI003465A82F
MNNAKLKPFRVFMRRRAGRTHGRIDVMATCQNHAERVAVAQNIEISHPKTKPGQWIVTSVQVLPAVPVGLVVVGAEGGAA